jgi:hypothetical protein
MGSLEERRVAYLLKKLQGARELLLAIFSRYC